MADAILIIIQYGNFHGGISIKNGEKLAVA